MNENRGLRPGWGAVMTANAIFLFLILALAGLLISYWTYSLKPRFIKEFQGQAEILSRSQAEVIAARVISLENKPQAPALLIDAMDNILLTSDPVTGQPYFASVALELDYDVVEAKEGSLDIRRQSRNCPSCFHTQAALFGPETGELVGVASFEVSDSFFNNLMDDILRSFLVQGGAGVALLIVVWLLVIKMIGKMNMEIHERRQAEEAVRQSEKRFRQIADSTFEGIMVIREDLVLDANVTAKIMTGYEQAGSSPTSISQLLSMEAYSLIHSLSRAEDERPAEVDMDNGAGRRRLELRVRNIMRPDGPAQVVAFRDITQQKQAERDLIQARDQAEAATKLKDKFLGLVSHDLRSPITGAAGALEILLTPRYDLEQEQKDEIIKETHRTLNSLVTLLDDLMNISRLRTGAIRPVKKIVYVRSLVEMYKAHLMPLARKKGITIENKLPAELRIYADASMIGEVFNNLISNAIKFCSKGDTVVIGQNGDSQSSLFVKDNGAGAPEEILPHIFDHDVKTSLPGTDGEKGTGLGLPYCNDIIAAHDGNLWVESKQGQGACFYIQLPPMRPLILLVDDQGGHRTMIREILEKEFSLDIAEAENGKEALEYLKDITPQLVIADIQMPVMDGFAFIKNLRDNPLFDSMPVIVATSHGSSQRDARDVIEVRQRVFSLGADDFVIKPVVPEDLVPRVRRLISKDIL